MSEQLIKWFIEQAEKHGYGVALFWVVVMTVGAFGLGSFVGWWIGQRTAIANLRKAGGEADQVRLENRKREGELIAELKIPRDTWQAATDTLNLHFGVIRDAILAKKGKGFLKDRRDEMCRDYSNAYMPALTAYLELIAAVASRDEKRIRAIGEILPALQTMVRFLRMANLTELMDRIASSEPFLLNKHHRDTLLQRTKALLRPFDIVPKYHLFQIRRTTKAFLVENP